MNKRIIYTIFIIFICVVSFFACSKKSNSSPTKTTNGQLYVVSNAKLANVADTIQAVMFDTKNNVTTFFYGSFDASGNPLHLRHAAVRHGDTVLNFLFDTAFLVQELYCTVAGVPDTTIFSFAYYTDSVALITYHTNWQANDMVLRSITKVSTANGNYSFISNKTFRTMGVLNWIVDAGYGEQAIKGCDFVINAGKVGIIALSGGLLIESGWVAEWVGFAIDNRGAIGLAIGAYEAPASTNTTQVSSLDNEVDPSTNQPVVVPSNPNDQPNSTGTVMLDFYFNDNGVRMLNGNYYDPFNAGSFCQYEDPATSSYSTMPTTQLHFRIVDKYGNFDGYELLFSNFTGLGSYTITYPVPLNSTAAYELINAGNYMTTNTLLNDWGQVNVTSIAQGYISGTFTLGTAFPQLPGDACGGCNVQDSVTNGTFIIPFKHQ